MHAKRYWLQAAIISLLSCLEFCNARIKHCDIDTLRKSEVLLTNHKGMRDYIEDRLGARLGTIIFVNWQDPKFHLRSPDGKPCRWRMLSPNRGEMVRFNDKIFRGAEFHTDPLNAKNYYRLVSCERKNCIQFYNVFMRPIAEPHPPVHIYHGKKQDVKCKLSLMQRREYNINKRSPPFRFEWTGPKDCSERNYNNGELEKCARYGYYKGLTGCDKPAPCTFKPNLDYLKGRDKKFSGTEKEYGYKDAEIINKEYESILRISKASEEHEGTWRCIVYDALNISSHPDDVTFKTLKHQGVHHRGIFNLHCKDENFSLMIPAAIIIASIVFIIISIGLCTTCPHYSPGSDS